MRFFAFFVPIIIGVLLGIKRAVANQNDSAIWNDHVMFVCIIQGVCCGLVVDICTAVTLHVFAYFVPIILGVILGIRSAVANQNDSAIWNDHVMFVRTTQGFFCGVLVDICMSAVT